MPHELLEQGGPCVRPLLESSAVRAPLIVTGGTSQESSEKGNAIGRRRASLLSVKVNYCAASEVGAYLP